ncbi:hypothetical protein K440DRAFT_633383 [Wilcoxina mikolae CBS 423.85]|nr:hypothetical protein K440DRAFT_633383 [Wilcoxina mikolae CBS 423.85]
MLQDIPKYPYPIQHTFKQSWFGLYGGKHIQFGNNVPESEYKTRRSWLPNIKQKKLYSESLGWFIPLRVATSVLRTVDKVGGLDNYLTGTKTARVKELGPLGWKLRWEVMNSPAYQKKRAAELEAFGLSATKAQVYIKEQIQDEKKLEEPVPVPLVQKPKLEKPELVADEAGNIKL